MANLICGECQQVVRTTILNHIYEEHPRLFQEFISAENERIQKHHIKLIKQGMKHVG